MERYVLHTSKLTKNYGKECALNGVDIHVPKGSIYALIGKNGAGKTTLTRILMGLSQQSEGVIELFGKTSKEDLERVRSKIGCLIETPTLYLDKNVYENLEINRMIKKVETKSKIEEVLDIVGLKGVGKKKVGNFSLGMRQRVAIAKALMGSPEFLILDEPINGLDPVGIIDIRKLMLELNNKYGVTILISSHILQELSLIATHYGIIDDGKILDEFTMQEFKHKKSKKILLISTDQNEKAKLLIQEKFNIQCIQKDNSMIGFEIPSKYETIHIELARAGINLYHFEKQEETLEEYYMRQIGERSSE